MLHLDDRNLVSYDCTGYEKCMEEGGCGCTDDYTPVCGRNVTTGELETFSNRCYMVATMCPDKDIEFVKEGECEGTLYVVMVTHFFFLLIYVVLQLSGHFCGLVL